MRPWHSAIYFIKWPSIFGASRSCRDRNCVCLMKLIEPLLSVNTGDVTMASSSRHPKECQLSKDFVKWHFGGWDIWQHFDLLERLDEFMDGRNINSVEKYNILVEDIAQSYRDPRNSPIEIDSNIYWDDGLDLEHFAWFRENGFPFYSMCRDVFEGKDLDTYARPYMGVEPFVPTGIDVCELTDIFRSYYCEVNCFCGRGTF